MENFLSANAAASPVVCFSLRHLVGIHSEFLGDARVVPAAAGQVDDHVRHGIHPTISDAVLNRLVHGKNRIEVRIPT